MKKTISNQLERKAYKICEYTVKAEALSPVHIGTGAMSVPTGYVVNSSGSQNFMYRFDPISLLKHMEEVRDDDNAKTMKDHLENQEYIELRSFLYTLVSNSKSKKANGADGKYSNWVMQTGNHYYKAPVSADYAIKFRANVKTSINSLQVWGLPRWHGGFYVPGSSIKGALRTPLSVYPLEGALSDLAHGDKKLVEAWDDPFRSLLVTDSGPIKEINIGVFTRTSASPGGGRIAQAREYLQTGATFKFTMRIREHMQYKDDKVPYVDQNGDHSDVTVPINKDIIVDKSNSFTQEKIKVYLDGINRMLAHRDMSAKDKSACNLKESLTNLSSQLTKIKKELNKIAKTQNSNEFILNIGGGGGFLFKTLRASEFVGHGGLVHPKYENGWSRRSVKYFHSHGNEIHTARTHWFTEHTLNDKEPMGFVKFTISK